MIFGPYKVIVVTGANKIVKDVDSALERIKNICAPQNAKRHQLYHWVWKLRKGSAPCEVSGICINCRSRFKLCNATTIIQGEPETHKSPRLHVVIVGEALGI